jgi:hypothetical protein
MELGASDFDPWATSSGESFRAPPKEAPDRSVALIAHGQTAGSDRYADRPLHQRERLARLGSPELTRHPEPTRGASRRGAKARPSTVNIFEDIARHASAYDVGSGRAMGAKYHRGGQRGHIGGYADLGSDNHYGLIGERTVKQAITAGYNDADNDGSSSRAAAIKARMEKLSRCAAAVVYVGAYSEARLTQLIGQASIDLRVHHREAWLLTNTQKPGFGATTAVDSGRGDSAKLRWCTVRMEDGLCVGVYWVEPGVPRFTAWVRPPIAGGSGTKGAGDDDEALAELAALAAGGEDGGAAIDAADAGGGESDWGDSASEEGGSSRASVVDVQVA